MALIEKLNAIGDAIREKTGDTEKMTLDAMVEAIAGIQTGGGGSEAIKAFVKNPMGAEKLIKNIVPMPAEFGVYHAYTNSADTISVSFKYGSEGDCLVAAFAVRQIEKPTTPQGWTEVAWIPFAEGDTYQQSVLVLSRNTNSANAGEDGVVEITGLVSGQRNYAMVLTMKGCSRVSDEVYTASYSGVLSLTVPLHDYTLAICSSSTTTGWSGTNPSEDKMSDERILPWITLNEVYSKHYRPLYKDESIIGGRLCAVFIPCKNQQPSDEWHVRYLYNAEGALSPGVIVCAMGLRVDTPASYACNLEIADS